ncbi:LLM class flavin-dependent oxidoreductase [Algoriphagus pacificus]|uniref:LLM class flavin-dependent oxidoreductase n=1 Tax=Algoriphagus pacificus TaxID=2811234 RepID=A0ABS3CK00_9BACT|nr:LLM class flavin-dependent oxidoreductase [Algoriphagus pacificus]MBN7817428.1 LLM class flavin-dependent oxidoreductase [Algoriphagus pacificus]
MKIPYSLLDLAIIRENHDAKEAYERSLNLAKHAEKLGYTRMWLAEHHNMANVGSSSPQILIGYLANGTSKIRLGSGGIMLPNHSPLVIAEQFGTLATLYPNRIDLGLGRAPGTDQTTAQALRRGRMESVQEFPNDLDDLRQYFSEENRDQKVRAFPAEGLEIPIYLLGSSMSSAVLASQKGLPYAFASHFAPGYLISASKYYRENFTPSEHLQKPYFISCVNVIAADTDEEASYLATSFFQTALGIIRGQSYPLKKPVESMEGIWTEPEAAAIQNMMACTFIGSKESLKPQFESFFSQVQVDELMISCNIYEPEKRHRSLEIASELFQ